MALKIRKLSEHIGAEIQDIDLTKEQTAETVAEINRAWFDNIILLFRGQHLDAARQLNVTKWFGEPGKVARPKEFHPKGYDALPEGIMLISNIRENGEPIGALPDGEMHFHSDGSHRAMPYRATTLYAIEVPDQGGETRFASMASAFEALPDDLQARLDGLSARHVFNYNKTTREGRRFGDDVAHAIHPLIRRHPDTGRKSLYLSRLMTRNIEGMDDTEGEALLVSLLDHCERPEFVYEHAWQPGDLVIWDNRSVNHARNDFPADQRRLLRRYTVSDSD